MIKAVFKKFIASEETGFVPYIVAGHPTNEIFKQALHKLDELGADLIEIGIPFTDPIAEGKTIEKAHHDVLKNDFSLNQICEITKEFKKRTKTPIIAMGYTNSFINPSANAVANLLSKSGFSGVLIVDLPTTETDILKTFKQADLEIISLVAPTTRLNSNKKTLIKHADLIYYITQRGITGANNLNNEEILDKISEIRNITDTPIITGFGINSVEHIHKLKNYVDGIVVGSSIVKCIEEDYSLASLIEYVKPLSKSTKK